MEDSGATVDVGSYTVHGTVTDNGGSYTPAPTTGAATKPDPFAGRNYSRHHYGAHPTGRFMHLL